MTSNEPVGEAEIWSALCRHAKEKSGPKTTLSSADGSFEYCRIAPDAPRAWLPLKQCQISSPAQAMLDLYMPLLSAPMDEELVVAHLGQSLDGRVATHSGNSQFISGQENLLHTHRMRALFDAVLVGANTARMDDPKLTTRLTSGEHPVRVVIDPHASIDPKSNLFTDRTARTLILCRERHLPANSEHHVGIADKDEEGPFFSCRTILDTLRTQGLRRIFIEGGGITVSRFLREGCLHRLHVCVAPMIIGSGRPAFVLPEIDRLEDSVFLNAKHFPSGDDILFDCQFRTRK
ncbi:MAG: RibD family protein [Kofleriaceae bacterium]|nr:RibD family protein [Kofleriaceae bacterium]